MKDLETIENTAQVLDRILEDHPFFDVTSYPLLAKRLAAVIDEKIKKHSDAEYDKAFWGATK